MTAEAKKKYFEKAYREAPLVECSCGCGEFLKSVDKYARPKKFINGHNRRRYSAEDATRRMTNKRWAANNPDKVRDNKKRFYRSRKLQAMEYLGNKCHFCSVEYDGTNAPIFEFHHFDPTNKEVGVTRILSRTTWEAVMDELRKCHLVCANCHNQYHGGDW